MVIINRLIWHGTGCIDWYQTEGVEGGVLHREVTFKLSPGNRTRAYLSYIFFISLRFHFLLSQILKDRQSSRHWPILPNQNLSQSNQRHSRLLTELGTQCISLDHAILKRSNCEERRKQCCETLQQMSKL